MKKLINIVCILFLMGWMIPKLFFVRIEPWQIGVRRSPIVDVPGALQQRIASAIGCEI